MQDFKPTKHIDDVALKMVQGMLFEFIVDEIINPNGKFYGGAPQAP